MSFSKVGIVDYRVSGTGIFYESQCSGNSTARLVIAFASGGNVVVVRGKITGQNNWEVIETTVGSTSIAFSLNTYDHVQLECTTFGSTETPAYIEVNFSGFEDPFGATIDDSDISLTETWSSSKISSAILGLGDIYVRSTRFATISSGTTGTITIPSEQEIVLDDFGGTIDAIVSTISGGRPTLTPAQDSGGTIVATTFNAMGDYALTSTPSSYPVALIYRVRQKLSTYVDTDANVVGFAQYDEVKSVNGKSGAVVLTATDVGALDAVNALTVELLWNQTYPSFYTEMTYDINDKVTQVDIWESSSKVTHIFTKAFTYTLNQVTQVTVTHHIDGATLVKNFTYDIDGYITQVDRIYTP